MAQEFENEEVRDRSSLNEEGEAVRQQERSGGGGGMGVEEFLQEESPSQVRETGGDDNGSGDANSGGSNGDNTPPDIGGDAPNDGSGTGSDGGGDDGGAEAENQQAEEGVQEGGLNFNLGPLSVSVAPDYSAITSAQLNFMGQHNIQTALQIEKKRKGYEITVSSEKQLAGGLGPFESDGGFILKKFKVTYNSSKNEVDINQLSIVAQGLRMGQYLQMQELTASYSKKKGFDTSIKNSSGTVFGNAYTAGKAQANIDARGNVNNITWTKIQAGANLRADSIEYSPSAGVRVRNADLAMPQIMGRTVRAKFNDLSLSPQGLAAEGNLSTDQPFTFLQDRLRVENVQSNIELKENDQWFVQVLGGVNFSDGPTKITGNFQSSFDSSGQAEMSLEGGNFETQLSGITFTSQGVSYHSETDLLQITEGRIQIPQLGPNFNASISNMTYAPGQGVDFERLALSASDGLEVFPGLKVQVNEAAIEKQGTNYSFQLANAVADLALASFKGHTQISLQYDQNTGLTGELHQLDAESPFFNLHLANAPFENGAFSIAQANISLQNMGPASGTEAQAQNIVYNQEGLSIGSANIELPSIGGVKILADVQDFKAANGGISVGSAKIQADGDITLAGGAVQIQNFDGDADFNGQAWNIQTKGSLKVNVPNTQAEGEVEIGYQNGQPTISLSSGKLQGTFGKITVDAKELSLDYGSSADQLTVGAAEVKIPDLAGLNVKTEVQNASFGAEGFNTDGIKITADGTLEPFKGFKISKIEGNFVKQGSDYEVKGQANAKLSSKSINGSIEGLEITYGTETTGMAFKKMMFTTPVTQGYVTEAEVTDEKISMGKASMFVGGLGVRKGKGYADKLKMTAEGLEYDKEGFRLASSSVTLPKIGGRQVSATVQNLNIPAEGGITGSGSLNLGGDIVLAGGAIKAVNPTPYFGLSDEGWDIGAKANIQFNTPGAQGSGDIDINYDKEEGLQVKVENGQASADLLNGALKLSASGLSFGQADPETGDGKLILESGKIELPKLGSGLTAEIKQLEVSNGDFNFEKLAITPEKKDFQIFKGLGMSLDGLEVSKKGGEYDASLKGGINLDYKNPLVKGSVKGSLDYNSKKGFSGKISALEVETSIFKGKATGLEVSTKGGQTDIKMKEARIGLGQGVNQESLGKYFPAISSMPWVLDVIQGVEFVAQDLSYNKNEGLRIGKIYPDIPPIEFEMMGLKGSLDLRNQKGSLGGQKKWNLKDFGIDPRVDATIPIVAGINGKLSLRASGFLNLGAGIEIARQPDGVWRLAGGISLDGEASVTFSAGISIGNRWLAEASAALAATLAIPFRGGAKIGTGIKYDPISKSMQVVDSLDFATYFAAELRTRLDLELEAAVLGGLWSGKTTYNIGDWLLGSLSFMGTSSGRSIGDMFGNFKADMEVFDQEATSLAKFGSGHDAGVASRLGLSRPRPTRASYD